MKQFKIVVEKHQSHDTYAQGKSDGTRTPLTSKSFGV